MDALTVGLSLFVSILSAFPFLAAIASAMRQGAFLKHDTRQEEAFPVRTLYNVARGQGYETNGGRVLNYCQ